MIYRLGKSSVSLVGQPAFIADNATLIGDIVLHDNCSIWFNAVIRADNDRITIGSGSNVQDGSVLHVDPGKPLVVGCNVTIGHKVVLHGCSIGDNTLIGINAVVLNGARVGNNCLVGANSLVPENMEIPDGSLVLGSPARVKRALTEAEIKMLGFGAGHYVGNARRYRTELSVHTLADGPDHV
jgi:carbonic anhydrase/acetyltransferase-like protein (isoleucine patch superfamily)